MWTGHSIALYLMVAREQALRYSSSTFENFGFLVLTVLIQEQMLSISGNPHLNFRKFSQRLFEPDLNVDKKGGVNLGAFLLSISCLDMDLPTQPCGKAKALGYERVIDGARSWKLG